MDSEPEVLNVKESQPLSLANYIKLEESQEDLPVIETPVSTGKEDEDISSTSSQTSSCKSSRIFESLKNPSGAWGTHRFERYPWSDYCRPCVRLEEYDDLSLDEDEESGLLTDPIISSCLSYLERSPYDLKYVFCKCVLSHKKLTDISALTYYHYIQYLDLSWNNITTLAPLGQLPFLQHLNASHNNIEFLLDFKAPFYLSFVNFSYNSIETIPDLTEFWSINCLNISNNRISKISGLEDLRYLNELNLSYNKLKTLEHLENLRIQFLVLHHNAIDDNNVNTMNLRALSYLRYVDLSNNKLRSLQIFELAENLENVNMSNNNVANLLELYYLQNLRYLSKLNLSDNPISEDKFYSNACLRIVKNLMVLDGKEISAEQRIEAKFSFEIDLRLKAGESHMKFILLQQLNHPVIGAHILPYDHRPPTIVILVGPAGSKKQGLAQTICKKIKKCVLGVSHTTRSKTRVEVEGVDYYFVTNEVFTDLTRRGRFIAVTEFNGYSYGITLEEIRKCHEGILIIHCEINTALSVNSMGFKPKLVLAMPRDEATHLDFLKKKYFYNDIAQGISRVENSPEYIRDFDTMTSMEGVIRLNRSILEDLIENVLDIIEDAELLQEELLQGNTEYTHVAHTVTPVPLSDDENIPGTTDVDNPSPETDILSSILKRGKSTKDGTRVSFFKSDHRQYASVSSKYESAVSNQSMCSESSYTSATDTSNRKDTNQITYRSVSEEIAMSEKAAIHGPLLSALSAQQVYCKSDTQTLYIRPTEIINIIRDEKLYRFYKNIVESREQLLQLHWSNPGLFREVIFTDEEEASFEKVKALLKFIVENYKFTKPNISMKDDPSYEIIVNSRFNQLDFQQPPRCKIDWNEARCICKDPEGSSQDV